MRLSLWGDVSRRLRKPSSACAASFQLRLPLQPLMKPHWHAGNARTQGVRPAGMAPGNLAGSVGLDALQLVHSGLGLQSNPTKTSCGL